MNSARRWLEPVVQRWWGGEAGALGAALSVVTLPVEWAFGAVSATRGLAYERGWLASRRADVPVVSVGNLSAGGTGKTPLSGWVVQTLLEQGHRPGVVARGYGQDEIDLLRRWFPGVPVVKGADRHRGATAAAAAGADVVVLDDGFQHRALRRDLDLVLLAAEQWPADGRPRLHPRGPYREPPPALARADGVLITRKTPETHKAEAVTAWMSQHFPDIPLVQVHLAPGPWTSLGGEIVGPPQREITAVCSVADPSGFAASLRRTSGRAVELLRFPDHHEYTEPDLQRIVTLSRGRALVTTEKDAVKLVHHAGVLGEVTVLCLEVRVGEGGDWLRGRLAQLRGAS